MKIISTRAQVTRKALVLDKEVTFNYAVENEQVDTITASCEIRNEEETAEDVYPQFSGAVLDKRFEALLSVVWRKGEPSSITVNARKSFTEYSSLLSEMETACIEIATEEALKGGEN